MGQRFDPVSRQEVTLVHMKTDLINLDSLFYFLPKSLTSEQVFSITVLSVKKKHVDFEVDAFNLLENQPPFVFFNCLENNLSFYDAFLFSRQQFLFCFQSFDLASGALVFSKKKKRVNSSNGLFSFLKEKHSMISRLKKNPLIKARLLFMVKGGFILSCFGNPAVLIKDSLTVNKQIYRNYRSWFSFNSVFFGSLSYFDILCFEKVDSSYLRRSLKFSQASRQRFYSIKNLFLGHVFILVKPKLLYF